MISRKKLTNVIFFLYYLYRCWFHKGISMQSSCRISQISSCSTNYVQTTHFHEQRITTGMVSLMFIYYLFIFFRQIISTKLFLKLIWWKNVLHYLVSIFDWIIYFSNSWFVNQYFKTNELNMWNFNKIVGIWLKAYLVPETMIKSLENQIIHWKCCIERRL